MSVVEVKEGEGKVRVEWENGHPDNASDWVPAPYIQTHHRNPTPYTQTLHPTPIPYTLHPNPTPYTQTLNHTPKP